MTTVLDVITGAAKLIGVLFKSETLANDEAQDGLDCLNDMLNSWSNDSGLTFANTRQSFNLSGGVAEYTIGTGGAFNTARPISITAAFIREGNIDYQLNIIGDIEYERITNKILSTSIPKYLNYSNEYPLATITLYPSPAAAYQLWLITKKPLGTYTDLTDVISLPQGFIRAIKYNLAIEMSTQYGVEPSNVVANIANKSLGDVRRSVSVNTLNSPSSKKASFYDIRSFRI